MPFGDWEGGELCFVEQGLVVKLHSCDFVAFPSHTNTHFNLHYKGLRGSFVLHSDRQGENWVKDFNGWQQHIMCHK
jgi:hypothetical protein